MGVTVCYRRVAPNGEMSGLHDLEVGWRSMFRELLDDHCLLGINTEADIPALERLAVDQHKGQRQPPFDWCEDIHAACHILISEIKQHGAIQVEALY